MLELETERLRLRPLNGNDAAFILELLNEPSFIRNIADRGVRTVEDARRYILTGPVSSYEKFGFGLYAAELKDSLIPIGMCGLLKRDSLDDVDIGFALLPRFWSKGYALEAARVVMAYGRQTLRLRRIVAITAPNNQSSARVLEKLGLRYEKTVQLEGIPGESWLYTPVDAP